MFFLFATFFQEEELAQAKLHTRSFSPNSFQIDLIIGKGTILSLDKKYCTKHTSFLESSEHCQGCNISGVKEILGINSSVNWCSKNGEAAINHDHDN